MVAKKTSSPFGIERVNLPLTILLHSGGRHFGKKNVGVRITVKTSKIGKLLPKAP
jgi:hypothetical protein